MDGRIINLQTSEGRIFPVKLNVARVSEMLKTMIEDLGGPDDYGILQLPSITGETLEKILEWMQYEYNRNQRVANGEENPDDELDENFWGVDLERLNAIAKGADYLDIGSLKHTACQVIENRLREQLTPSLLHVIFLSIFP